MSHLKTLSENAYTHSENPHTIHYGKVDMHWYDMQRYQHTNMTVFQEANKLGLSGAQYQYLLQEMKISPIFSRIVDAPLGPA